MLWGLWGKILTGKIFEEFMLMGVIAVVNLHTETGGPDEPVSIPWGEASDIGGFWVNHTDHAGGCSIKFTPVGAEQEVTIAVTPGKIHVWADVGGGNGERRQLEVYLNP